MRYCKMCLATDTRPGIEFDENGLCMACVYSKQKKEKIDWKDRQKQLQDIVKSAKKNNHGGYDCIIGVSGGKDSHFQALYAKEELGLNCLLVNCAPDKITEVGRHNIENLVNQGFDMISFRPNPKVMQAVTRRAFYEHGNPVKPSEYPLFAVSYQTALAFHIPLIIQGENPGLILGSTKNYGTNDDAFNIVMGNTVDGGKASDWFGDGVDKKNLLLYQFPDKNEMKKAGIRAIYLQYYVKEWSADHNTKFAVKRGLKGRPNHPWLVNPYGSVDSDMVLLNNMVKYYKLGFSSWTQHTGVLIRNGKMTREEAITLVTKYDGYYKEEYVEEFCDYIGITIDEFWREMEEKIINKKLFKNVGNRKWKPLFKVGVDFNEDNIKLSNKKSL
jgi:N-acetyl sugar amidotransferase